MERVSKMPSSYLYDQ
ncbi:hypothetical protein OHF21_13870 [Escherichia coli]|nr:hypothetical protein [Escherichia coli]MCV3000602.1 hypothetical protein [Escherichia coli]MCV5075308.1 hypothetical protein [Escherichia coli]MCV5080710.1 hypothetical protein [Escherichia coli]MCV5097520.1 hypothetical protein [Escherichia coli]MCV5107373.1 hypothetical protein [Escherichia coli]